VSQRASRAAMLPVSRRRFLVLVSIAASLLSACVQTAPASPTAAPKPTEAPKPAAPVASPAASPAASPGASPAASPAAQAAPGAAVREVLIGVSYPLSGATAPSGLDAKAAVELAQDVVNNRTHLPLLLARTEGLPNLGGAKVRAIITDHQGDPAVARRRPRGSSPRRTWRPCSGCSRAPSPPRRVRSRNDSESPT